ncbi:MAG: hypothetical protein B9S32_05360 [Verrucomicrobia bacterium Tous-C9LFEB]|nr:MAG: hypothetical protein B9S32_05360 [Verrucomicrobia bacterium Tous-C9LFEB]
MFWVLVFAVIGFFSLFALYHLIENRLGAARWAETKSDYAAKVNGFDPQLLIPPPISRDQNFAETPIWRRFEQYKKVQGKETIKVALFTANDAARAAAKKQSANWLLGQPTQPPDPALFDGTESELTELYTAAEKPLCRFNIDYTHSPAYGIPLPQTRPLMSLAQALRWHALLSLSQQQPNVAIKDMTLSLRLAAASEDCPLLIMGLIGSSIRQMNWSLIWQGIESHAWTDEQLALFQSEMSRVNELKSYGLYMRSELCLCLLPMLDLLQHNPHKLKQSIPASKESESPFYNISWGPYTSKLLIGFILNSSDTYDDARYQACHILLDELLPVVDSEQHRFYADRIPDLDKTILSLRRNVPNLILGLGVGQLQNTALRFSESQARTDLALVACGLERYWLANKKYPATLAELEPRLIERVPHDLCNGEPLHYRVEADGNYTLYSVGFNGVDDGGKVVMKKESTTAIDPQQGDWVWPRLKR